MVSRIVRSPVFLQGVAIWLLGFAFWALLWFTDRQQAVAAAAALGAFLAAGKIVAITLGLSLGGDPLVIGISVVVPDAGAIFVFHPVTTMGIEQLGKWSKRVKEAVERAKERNLRQEGMIAKHGAWGLFLIALIPVGFYSPLVIAGMGQLAGLGVFQTIFPVVAAIALMTALYVVALNAGLSSIAELDPRLPTAIGLAITVVFIGWNLIKWFWKRKTPPPEGTPPPTPVPSATPPAGPPRS